MKRSDSPPHSSPLTSRGRSRVVRFCGPTLFNSHLRLGAGSALRGLTSRASDWEPEAALFRLEELKSRLQKVAEIDLNNKPLLPRIWASHYDQLGVKPGPRSAYFALCENAIRDGKVAEGKHG